MKNYKNLPQGFNISENEKLLGLIKSAQNGDEFDREEIIERHLWLVMNICEKYENRYSGVLAEDLMADGIIALQNALDKFDISKGKPFRAYVYQAVTNAVSYSDLLFDHIKLPAHIKRLIKKIKYARYNLIYEDPSSVDIANFVNSNLDSYVSTKVTAKEVYNIENKYFLSHSAVYMEDTVIEDDFIDYHDVIGTVDNQFESIERENLLQSILNYLNETEQNIIKFYFGVLDYPKLTCEAIAQKISTDEKSWTARQVHAAKKKILEKRMPELREVFREEGSLMGF